MRQQHGPSPAPAERASSAAGPAGAPGAQRRAAVRRYLPVLAAAAVMAALGLWGLGRDSAMGNDEVVSRWAALLSLHQLAHLLDHVDAVHGLYYFLLHGWMAVGTSPAVMRLPSVIGMTAAAAMVAIIARRLTGSGLAALSAGLIMALTPDITFYAQTARSYALVFACVTGATLVLLHALEAERGGGRPAGWWVAYGVLVTLGSYLNELAALMLLAHAVTVLLARYGRRAFAHWAVTGVVSMLALIPLALITAREDGAVSWIARPGLVSLRNLWHDYFGTRTVVALLVSACVLAALLPPRAAWWKRGGISLESVALPLLLVPSGLLLLESLVARPLYVDRYVLYGEAGAALLAGTGAYRIGQWLAATAGRSAASRRLLLWAPAAVVCACALVLQLGVQQRLRTPVSRLYDFGGPSRYVAAHARDGDGVMFFNPFFRKAELGYPSDFARVSDFALAVRPVRSGTFTGVDKSLAATRPLMLAQPRIWVIGRLPSPTRLGTVALRAESAVLLDHFTLAAKRHFRGMYVTLWVRR